MVGKTQHRQKSLVKARQELAAVALAGIERLRRSALDLEREYALELDGLAPELRRSAVNLLHYLAVRHHDIRELQGLLVQLGMSSLGRMEAHAMATLNAVSELLRQLLGHPLHPLREFPQSSDVVSFAEGAKLLAHHADVILGPCVPERKTRIMVTMPSEAADDPELVRDLVANGMEIMRINCAHDSPAEWTRMIRHLRRAEKALGRRCRISFDLAGPKLRTGAMEAGTPVAKWKPARNQLGRVVAPAWVTLAAREAMIAPEPGMIPVQGNLPMTARIGDPYSPCRCTRQPADAGRCGQDPKWLRLRGVLDGLCHARHCFHLVSRQAVIGQGTCRRVQCHTASHRAQIGRCAGAGAGR